MTARLDVRGAGWAGVLALILVLPLGQSGAQAAVGAGSQAQGRRLPAAVAFAGAGSTERVADVATALQAQRPIRGPRAEPEVDPALWVGGVMGVGGLVGLAVSRAGGRRRGREPRRRRGTPPADAPPA